MGGFGQVAQGALGGGLGGGAFGPGGAVLGAGLGALGGLLGGSGLTPEQEEAQRRMMALSNGGFNPAQAGQSDIRGQQLAQLQRLTALAEGRGPSLALQQMNVGLNQAQAANQAMAGSATTRGVGPGAAYRNAASTSAAQQQNMIGQAGMARAAEQLGALQQLTGAQYGARGQDETLGMFNANQMNDASLRDRLLRMQALSGIMGNQPGAGLGEQLLAGGANMYSMIGPRK